MTENNPQPEETERRKAADAADQAASETAKTQPETEKTATTSTAEQQEIPTGKTGTPAAAEQIEIASAIIGERPPSRPPFRARAAAFLKGMPRRYFITAFSGMAIGLFCTLIAGTILEQISKVFYADSPVRSFLANIASLAKILMGAGIGLGIAHSLKAPKMVLASCTVIGFLGANAISFLSGPLALQIAEGGTKITAYKIGVGDPITSYVCSVIACELGILVSGRTKVDILAVPLTVLLAGALVALALGRPIGWLMGTIGMGIDAATRSQPFIMGMVVSAAMGLLLTLPTSSAAIGVSIGLNGIAAGAAVAGCCAHMVGFAVSSFRENRWGGLVAQGLGTSMLQIPNLGKNGRILIPPVIASVICGPVASCVFQLRATPAGSGMGTAGLVGVIDAVGASVGAMPLWQLILGIGVTCFLLPAVISLVVSEFMRRRKWIRPGDMKIDV